MYLWLNYQLLHGSTIAMHEITASLFEDKDIVYVFQNSIVTCSGIGRICDDYKGFVHRDWKLRE